MKSKNSPKFLWKYRSMVSLFLHMESGKDVTIKHYITQNCKVKTKIHIYILYIKFNSNWLITFQIFSLSAHFRVSI